MGRAIGRVGAGANKNNGCTWCGEPEDRRRQCLWRGGFRLYDCLDVNGVEDAESMILLTTGTEEQQSHSKGITLQ